MKVCIICGKEIPEGSLLDSIKLREDNIIKGIRKIKEILHTAKNNELYVCPDDIDTYKKKRDSFHKNLLFVGIAAFLLFLIVGVLPVFSGLFNLSSFVFSVIFGILLLFFVFFFKYVPEPEEYEKEKLGEKPQEGKSRKSFPAFSEEKKKREGVEKRNKKLSAQRKNQQSREKKKLKKNVRGRRK